MAPEADHDPQREGARVPTPHGDDPVDFADLTVRLARAREVDEVLRLLGGRAAARHRVRADCLAGIAILERWPSAWPRALDCFLASLARCTETFRDSLGNDNLEWAGCAAALVLDRFTFEARGGGGDGVLKKLASFAYYALSCLIRDPGRATANALLARAALMRGPAARHIDGPWREAPACLAAMCAAADDHDAIARWREGGFAGPVCSCFDITRPPPDGAARGGDDADRPSFALGSVLASGRAIHAHLYESRGSCFERGYYNIFNIADILSLVSGATEA